MTISVAPQLPQGAVQGITGQRGDAGLDLFQLLFAELSSLGQTGDLFGPLTEGQAQLPNLDSALSSSATLDVRMQVTVEEIQFLSKGGIDVSSLQDVSDLEAAYIKLGLDPAEAKARADKVDLMLKRMDKFIEAMKSGLIEPIASPLLAETNTETQDTAKTDIWTEQRAISAFKYVRTEAEIVATLKQRILNKEPLVDAPEFQQLELGDLAQKPAEEIQATLTTEQTEESLADSEAMQQLIAELSQDNKKKPAEPNNGAEATANTNMAERNIKAYEPKKVSLADLDPALAQSEKVSEEINKAEPISLADAKATTKAAEEIAPQQQAQILSPKDKSEKVTVGEQSATADSASKTEEGIDLNNENTSSSYSDRKDQRAPVEQKIDWQGERSQLTAADQSKAKVEPVQTLRPTAIEVQPQIQADGSMAYVDVQTGDIITQQDLPRPSAQQPTFSEQLRQSAQTAEVAQQTKLSIKPLAEQGGGKIRIDLNPPELGEIEVELDIQEGLATGKISVKNPEVLEQLARDLKVLQQGLAEAGVELKDENMTFAVMEDDQQQDQQGQNQNNGNDQEEAEDIALDSTQQINDKWVRPDALVDMDV